MIVMAGRKPTLEEIEACMLSLLAASGPGKSIAPFEVGRALAGSHPEQWGPLMQPIRRVAVKLMREGRVVILRKGRPVDPDDFRGVYRLALPAEGGSGAGNSASV